VLEKYLMKLYRIDPLVDIRWDEFIKRHPDSTVFHTPGWLHALQLTYGYQPLVYTTSTPSQELSDGIVFCEVNSWLTGKRAISVPFADHCQPLVDYPEKIDILLNGLSECRERQGWKYIEVRPLESTSWALKGTRGFLKSEEYCFHKLDLKQPLPLIYRQCHQSSFQAKVRKAKRVGLCYEVGTSEALLSQFYDLFVMTRRRHFAPPQPIEWFQNLLKCLGDKINIRVASQNGRPIASIITTSWNNTMIYKYGCSNPQYMNLGGTPLLLWKAIEEAKSLGLEHLDLGRSECSNIGLITFKGHMGAISTIISYYKYPFINRTCQHDRYRRRMIQVIIERAPDNVFILAGRLLYKHIA
jgi:hypothetical protein